MTSDINWKKATAETQYEVDALYLLDYGGDGLELALLCVDEEAEGKLWIIEHEAYDFDDIEIEYYAKCGNGKL